MGRRHRQEEHTNHEAWAIPYGDLVTLLLAFFVVMYAISTLNEGKYRVMSDSLREAFDGESLQMDALSEGSALGSTAGAAALIGAPAAESLISLSERARTNLPINPIEQRQLRDAAAQIQQQLDAIQRQVERALGSLILSDQVTVTRQGLWLEVNIRSDVLFASGSAALESQARQAIQQLASVLRELPNEIRIEGHTDNQPIASAMFPSNWELSAGRATSVIRLLESQGVDPRRMAAIGYGDKRPIGDNATAAGRADNRRVMLVILATPGISQENAAAAVQTGAAAAEPNAAEDRR